MGSVSDDFIISDTHLKQAYSSFALLCYANSAVKSRLRGKTCKGEKTISIYSIPSHGTYLLSSVCFQLVSVALTSVPL